MPKGLRNPNTLHGVAFHLPREVIDTLEVVLKPHVGTLKTRADLFRYLCLRGAIYELGMLVSELMDPNRILAERMSEHIVEELVFAADAELRTFARELQEDTVTNTLECVRRHVGDGLDRQALYLELSKLLSSQELPEHSELRRSFTRAVNAAWADAADVLADRSEAVLRNKDLHRQMLEQLERLFDSYLIGD